MSKRDKLLDRLRRRPTDFQWGELESLLRGFGYELEKGSGSRRKFYCAETQALICLHEPHPQSTLKMYQLDELIQHLKERGLL
ncbi:MAG TPA: hypothetical protein DEQ47_11445 [Solibacterales bacterium]|nr:hypothetical protein [Bryobacterales bacterium]